MVIKRGGRLIGLGVVLVALLWLLQWAVLPSLVRQKVASALSNLGLSPFRFQVDSASLWGTELRNLEAGDGVRVHADAISVRYTPWSALAGSLDLIRISGADVELQTKKGRPPMPATKPASEPAAPLPFKRLELLPARVRLPLNNEPGKQAVLNLQGTLHNTAGVLEGQLQGSTEPLRIEDEKTLASLWPAAGDWALTGQFSLDGQVQWRRGQMQPRIRLSVQDAAIKSKAYDVAMEGISGETTISQFAPLTTPGNQPFSIRHATVGKFEGTDGRIAFRIESPGSILIERTQWGWAGGSLYAYAFRIDPAHPAVNLIVYADHLELKQLLPLISSGQASGEGVLYARVPVAVNWPRVTLGEGFVYATGGGWMKLGETVAVVGDLLDQSDPRFKQQPELSQVKTRMMVAMRDFQYDVLKVDFKSDGNKGLVASVQVHGKGRTGDKPQEVYLTVNTTGLDQLFNEVLVIKKAVSSFGQERRSP